MSVGPQTAEEKIPSREHGQLRQVVGVLLLTSVPALAVTVYLGLRSGSLSVAAIVLDTGVNLVLNATTYVVLGVALRGNVFRFPHGTGKLENFTSFLHGLGMLLAGGLVLSQAVSRLAAPPPAVSLGLAGVAVLAGLVRVLLVLAWLRRIVRRHPDRSPLLHVYHVSFVAAAWYATGLAAAMGAGWLAAARWGARLEVVADLVIAAAFALYQLLCGVRVLHANFRALVDLPLPERDQLAILRVLARHDAAYTGLLNVFTRASGGQRCVELELELPPGTPVERIEELRGRMRHELAEALGSVELHLIARCPARGAQPRV